MGDGGSYDGNVDWDAEWKKVVDNKDQPSVRPGKDFYKSDLEKAIGKTTRAAQEQISKVQMPNVQMRRPSMPSFSGDAKLCLAIIAAISIGSAILSASSPYSND